MVDNKIATIQWLDHVPSTNSWLLDRAKEFDDDAVASMNQTEGKGRRGRTWESSQGQMLALSILVKGPISSTASLVAGVCVAKAIARFTNQTLTLKWPNDVLANSKKICGILCESRIQGNESYGVIGIGVNVSQRKDFFAKSKLPYATSILEEYHLRVDPMQLAEEIIKEWKQTWPLFLENPAIFLQEEYKPLCATLHKMVSVLSPSGEELFTGTALSITEDGLLIIDTANGIKTCRAGEVSVRGIYGYGE